MNYQQPYDNLIIQDKNRLLDFYRKTHRIILKCMCDTNDQSSLAELIADDNRQKSQSLEPNKKRSKEIKTHRASQK